ncbi:hypothetical protein F5148DRAFT_1372095 [Russula earlei]|uniref:Uncharacterized protein n=1 Tax=Russula earlei TaxID=71964 RepID=A0ACC0TR89_9AGAM|nr:hypothetical protein F5148DRAFT_1372095 [Russula earlei]
MNKWGDVDGDRRGRQAEKGAAHRNRPSRDGRISYGYRTRAVRARPTHRPPPRPLRDTHCSRMQQGSTQLAAAIAVEKLDEFENPVRLSRRHPVQSHKHKAPAKHKQAIMDDANTDADDTDFTTSSAEYGSEDPSDATEISNEEVQNILT